MANRQSTKPAISTWAERYITRFWSKVDRSGGANACWLWSGSTTRGYGQAAAHGWTYLAHRVSYELSVGPVPEGLTLDHLCRVRNCVNPAHLEPVTSRENILRGIGPTARNKRKRQCDNGHSYTPENTILLKSGHRMCLECRRANHREKRKRVKAKRGPRPRFTKTACGRGHEFTEATTFWETSGKRRCRICLVMNRRRRRLERKAKAEGRSPADADPRHPRDAAVCLQVLRAHALSQ